jgi:hypothetical protein
MVDAALDELARDALTAVGSGAEGLGQSRS